MPSRSCAHISAKSSQPRPSTDTASVITGEGFANSPRSAPGARRAAKSAGRHRREPQNVKCHVGGRPRAPQEIIEQRPSGKDHEQWLRISYPRLPRERQWRSMRGIAALTAEMAALKALARDTTRRNRQRDRLTDRKIAVLKTQASPPMAGTSISTPGTCRRRTGCCALAAMAARMIAGNFG